MPPTSGENLGKLTFQCLISSSIKLRVNKLMHVKYLAQGLTKNKQSANTSYYHYWDHGPGIHPGALRFYRAGLKT